MRAQGRALARSIFLPAKSRCHRFFKVVNACKLSQNDGCVLPLRCGFKLSMRNSVRLKTSERSIVPDEDN